MSGGVRVACDVGGTFTDLAVRGARQQLRIYKAPTTVDDGGIGGIKAAIDLAATDLHGGDAAAFLAEVDQFVLATTKALNAVLEQKTPPVAFLTTTGHPDILSLREGGKPSIHPHAVYPAPLVPRRLTFQVRERIDAQGTVLEPLDEVQVRGLLAEIASTEAEAVAVCLLWSTVNPTHEARVGELIADCLPGLPCTLSHRANPIIREYRRACATVIDASLKPLMTAFLTSVEASLRGHGLRGAVLSATSAGTMLPLDEVAGSPVQAVHCGPALAPVAGAAFEGSLDGEQSVSLVVVDAGGTSFDVSFVHAGEVALTGEHWLGGRLLGHLLGLPVVDVVSIGSGGGSIARVDSAGLVRVGPQSAGAEPGPACYGRGGTAATVTDAAVVAGLVDPAYFLGGRFPLDPVQAREAVFRHVAEPAGLELEEAAATVLTIAERHMSDAIEETSINHGIDLALTTLVAGGGSCGLSIDQIASELGCPRVVVPFPAAALSACGGIVSELARDYRASVHATTESLDLPGLRAAVDDLAVEAEGFLDSLVVPRADRRLRLYLEGRYVHQRWEIELPLDRAELDRRDFADLLRRAFHAEHDRLYGVSHPESEVEIVGLRARPAATTGKGALTVTREVSAAPPRSRPVYLGELGWVEARVVRGGSLALGDTLEGPAILEEPTTTILVRPGSRLVVASEAAFVLFPAGRGHAPEPAEVALEA